MKRCEFIENIRMVISKCAGIDGNSRRKDARMKVKVFLEGNLIRVFGYAGEAMRICRKRCVCTSVKNNIRTIYYVLI